MLEKYKCNIPKMYKERYPFLFNNISENVLQLKGIVSLDIDGVIQATYKNALNNASHILKTSINKDQLRSFWELDIIARKYLGEDTPSGFAKEIWNNNQIYETSPQICGTETLLKILNEINISHIFISSRPPEFFDSTRKWFSKMFPWIDSQNIILGRSENMFGGEFKARIINERGVALHIEDSFEEASAIVERSSAKVLLVPQPWNVNGISNYSRLKVLRDYDDESGVWPIIRFLGSKEARIFLSM